MKIIIETNHGNKVLRNTTTAFNNRDEVVVPSKFDLIQIHERDIKTHSLEKSRYQVLWCEINPMRNTLTAYLDD